MDNTLKFQARQYLSNDGLLARFMPISQRFALLDMLNGEEGEFFIDKVHEIAKIIRDMPKTYETDDLNGDAIVQLHYFGGSIDAWVTEKDAGDGPDDARQIQAFGKITLTGNKEDGELDYISIEELVENGIELDLYWTPRTLKEL